MYIFEKGKQVIFHFSDGSSIRAEIIDDASEQGFYVNIESYTDEDGFQRFYDTGTKAFINNKIIKFIHFV